MGAGCCCTMTANDYYWWLLLESDSWRGADGCSLSDELLTLGDEADLRPVNVNDNEHIRTGAETFVWWSHMRTSFTLYSDISASLWTFTVHVTSLCILGGTDRYLTYKKISSKFKCCQEPLEKWWNLHQFHYHQHLDLSLVCSFEKMPHVQRWWWTDMRLQSTESEW